MEVMTVDARLQVADKKVPCSLAIYENTCASWQTAAHACFSQSMVSLSHPFHLLRAVPVQRAPCSGMRDVPF